MNSREVLERLSAGRFTENLYDAIVRVSEEVLRTGKVGGVSVNLKIQKAQGSDTLVTIQEVVGVSLPKPEGTGAFFFVHEKGLHSRDPRQPELPIVREVEPNTAEPRSVDAGTGEVRNG